jgi:tetratricopeptide (TPR) repeat protein
MLEVFPELEVEGCIGIATGEVVTATEERLATGDAVNVAARLQQAAHPGEALIGKGTLALVGSAVEVEAVEPLVLKGKAEPVPAYRLVGVREAAGLRPESRFVGRRRELAAIHETWGRAVAERRCDLLTIVGEAGVGKSRLVAEALASLGARVAQGRCLPYGEGITYWPVVEIINQLGAAQAYYELGRLEDAEAWADRGAKLAGSDDAHVQTIWRQVKAKVLARGGDHAEAERFARRAVELSEQTDMLIDQGRALADLGDVLALAGRTEAAAEAYEQALARCERKEYLVMAERIRARLVELRLSETAQRA